MGGDDVGRIDMILVKSGAVEDHPMEWAALEIQAVPSVTCGSVGRWGDVPIVGRFSHQSAKLRKLLQSRGP